MKTAFFVLAAVIVVSALPANVDRALASPIEVSTTVSGSPGDWTYNFSITNNLDGTNDVYFWGVALPADATTQPTGWPALPYSWITGEGTGSHTEYSTIWCSNGCRNPLNPLVLPGETLSGFSVETSQQLAIIPWFAYAFNGFYDGPDCFWCGHNPGFEGLSATGLLSAVPEPSTWAMLLIGFAGIGFAACRKRELCGIKGY
jgi:PEP-CTERM motif-containing protein